MSDALTAPIIVTALFGPEDFIWLDDLRQTHFPAERNQLRAHLTLFHHLPPSVARELRDALKDVCREPAPDARISGLMNLGRGVAYRIDSEGLTAARTNLADRFELVLTPQDRQNWRAHVTVQNKAPPAEAKALLADLSTGFVPRPVAIAGLAAWWYRGGPWELIDAFAFRGSKLPRDYG